MNKLLWLALIVMWYALPVTAATINVTTTTDEYGPNLFGCSLREAIHASEIAAAFGGCTAGGGLFGDIIALPAGVYKIQIPPSGADDLSSGDFNVNGHTLSFQGVGARQTIIDGAGLDRVFNINLTTQGVSFSKLAIRGGAGLGGQVGGGILAQNGTLQLRDVVVAGNKASLGGGLYAAGQSSLSIQRSAFLDNSSDSRGAGLFLQDATSATLENVTISHNHAHAGGGGIAFAGAGSYALNDATVAYNTSGLNGTTQNGGAGLYASSSVGLTVSLANSIVAGNLAIDRIVPDFGNDCDRMTLTSRDYNLIQDVTASCPITGATAHNLYNVDPLLLPVFDYGSGVPTQALLPESPARAAGNPANPGSGGGACASDDARGVNRSAVAPRCDIGAYQYYADFNINTMADLPDSAPGDGQCRAANGSCSLRAAIQEASASTTFRTAHVPAGQYLVNYTDPNNTNTGLNLASNFPVTVIGDDTANTVIKAAGGAANIGIVLSASATNLQSAGLALARFTLAGGNAQDVMGSSGLLVASMPVMLDALNLRDNIACRGALELFNANVQGYGLTINGNLASQPSHDSQCDSGGGAFVTGGSVLALTNSTISGNRALRSGGGIYVQNSDVYLSNITIAGNVADFDNNGGESGGGIARDPSGGNVYMAGSILANNSRGAGSADDCAAVVSSLGYNLIRTTGGCTIAGNPQGDILGQDPRLSSLALQGGPTATRGLEAASPALDQIPHTACVDVFGNALRADQRGVIRHLDEFDVGPLCDIGAFEGLSDVIFADGF
jgi:CSLREA domain-containing protein